ncbi:hypothetical protein CRUP_032871, partial [Coryphaenoides rupestris]
MDAALEFQRRLAVPSTWRTEVKEESSSSEEEDEEEEEEQEEDASSEELHMEEVEPFPEERENFLQQLYKFMEDRGTPINKRPVLGYRNLNLFKLYRLVHKLGGFDSIESGSVWKQVYQDLGIPVLNSAAGYNVKCAYRKYLNGFEEYCTSTAITFRMDLPLKQPPKAAAEVGKAKAEAGLAAPPASASHEGGPAVDGMGGLVWNWVLWPAPLWGAWMMVVVVLLLFLFLLLLPPLRLALHLLLPLHHHLPPPPPPAPPRRYL